MWFGSHERLSLQILQILLHTLVTPHFLSHIHSHIHSFCWNLYLLSLMVAGHFMPWALVSLAWCVGLFSDLPAVLGPNSGGVPSAFLTTYWYPSLLWVLGHLTVGNLADFDQVSNVLIVGLCWWLRGLWSLPAAFSSSLERPPPWPDPAPYVLNTHGVEVGWGYSLRSGSYVRSKSRSGLRREGWVPSHTCTCTCAQTPFAILLLDSVNCMSTFWSDLLRFGLCYLLYLFFWLVWWLGSHIWWQLACALKFRCGSQVRDQ